MASIGAHLRGVGEDDVLGALLTRPGYSVGLSDSAGEVVDEDEAPVATVLDDARVLPPARRAAAYPSRCRLPVVLPPSRGAAPEKSHVIPPGVFQDLKSDRWNHAVFSTPKKSEGTQITCDIVGELCAVGAVGANIGRGPAHNGLSLTGVAPLSCRTS